MKLEDISSSKTFKIIIGIIGGLIAILLIFKIGVVVGTKKALFACRWAEHYAPNFVQQRNGIMDKWMRDFNEGIAMKSHGAVGTIIKIDNLDTNTAFLIVKGEKEVEKAIVVSPETIIEKWEERILPADLRMGDYVVVIGDANDEGQIEAKLIRVIPHPFPPEHLGGL
ncbi:MAG: hypothetical protein WC579_00230 [Candidatus Paceibacterota bacterium]|jgi:hypothetical protein|nr:hypothetical protein [Candidatus Paceibacterota bacterium]HQM34993.1 hypothetical protein [Candidatus Paceibacterota bacterium]